MKYVLVLLAGLPPIGLLYRLIPLNSSWILNVSKYTEKVISYENYKFVLLSYVTAFALSYAFHYRNMKEPKRIAFMFLQVMLIFPLILLLCLVFPGGEDGLDLAPINPEPSPQDPGDHSDVPLTPSNTATATATATAAAAGENTAWYYSKKFWVGITIVGLAAIAYYLKGSAPASSDDMASFNATVSQGIENVASSQASLHQTLSERVNSVAFQADLLNRTSEGMLSDIAVAGDAARLQLEQTRGLTQDLTLMNDRVSTLDERMTSLLRGLLYLISLRWLLSRRSEDVNVFSFENSDRVTEVAVQAATETTSILTQTENTESDRIYSILRPAIQAHDINRILLKLRQVIPIITESILSIDSELGEYSTETQTDTQSSTASDLADQQRLTDSVDTHIPALESSPDEMNLRLTYPVLHSTESESSTSELSPSSPHSSEERNHRVLNLRTPQSSEITPQSEPSVNRILVCDNPTFQSSSPTSNLYPDDTNPYQVHRYNFHHIRVGRYLPCFLQLLERLGL